MSAATPLIGLGFGALLVAVGLALWGGLRRIPKTSHAVRAVGWISGALLLIAAPLLWIDDTGHPAPALRLILMAGIAAPLTGRHRSLWRDTIAMLPALVLTGASFFLITESSQPNLHSPELTLVGLALTVCDGLVVRVLSEALGSLASPVTPPGQLFDVLYLLLTLLLGTHTLASLWQRGVAWEGSGSEGGLIGAWLVWSAAWLSPRRRRWLRAGLIAVAAIALTVLALRFS